MATRNPANEIQFGQANFGAPVVIYAVSGATGVAAQTAPGEDLESFVELVQLRGTIVGLGVEAGGAFNVYVENSSWDVASLQTATQALGGVFATATVIGGTL
jgi:hypothetical protein